MQELDFEVVKLRQLVEWRRSRAVAVMLESE
jgi:hypothetical protein